MIVDCAPIQCHTFYTPARPDPPELTLPSDIFDDNKSHVEVLCGSTSLGRPRSSISLERKLPGEADFSKVDFDAVKKREHSSCVTSERGYYVIAPSHSVNGTVFRCVMTSSEEDGGAGGMSVEKTLTVIPSE